MLFSILQGGSPREVVINLLLIIPVVLISLSVHEAAHGYIAHKLGDHTAYFLGRVTINPAKHLDPIGSLFMLVFGYGWAKPVPINARNFKNPKKGMAYTAIAGPISNLILGVIGTLLYTLSYALAFKYLLTTGAANEFVFNVLQVLMNFFFYLGFMNFVLAAFNLIPVPPFDGSRFFSLFMPERTYFAMMRYERYIMLGVLVFMIGCSRLFGFSPFSWIAQKIFTAVSDPLFSLWEILLF